MQQANVGSAFVAAALGGGFAVNTAAAQQMLMSIGQMQLELTRRMKLIDQLVDQAKLGDLEEARFVSKLDTQVAAGGPESLDHAMRRFADALAEAHQAVQIGMKNYAEVEALAAKGFRR